MSNDAECAVCGWNPTDLVSSFEIHSSTHEPASTLNDIHVQFALTIVDRVTSEKKQDRGRNRLENFAFTPDDDPKGHWLDEEP
ncbi:hypothetical protein CC78DRAFT_618584 [Lojkania enalia]|uniref:Uncharacterized protein n=1 Tax=Lojkania enalia TaxID=147567 RepID=A0A9P4K686_9PLEO|nr:hypothetical protein CC78DRAFT_618584 [Didymosphaeria enalia]